MFFFKNLTEAQRKLAATIGFVVMIVALLAMSGLNDKQAPQDTATGAETSEQVVAAANEQAASSDEHGAADKTEATDEQAAADKTEATTNASGEASTDAAAAMTQSSEDKAN